MKIIKLLLTAVIVLAFFTGCGTTAINDAEKYISDVNEIRVPDDVTIIGFGEATHGNVEFQELKKDLFEALITNEDVRIFVLEGDFGGAQQINDYILHGKGSAEEAVFALDYGIYNTKQMIDLVEWLYEYNQDVSKDEKVYFYGNDMQRYDYSKEELLTFYKAINEGLAAKYTEQLQPASNNTMRNLNSEQLKEIDEVINDITTDLQSNQEKYVKKTSQEGYALALQYANVIKQRTELFQNENEYAMLRDKYLAQNLKWIAEFEAQQGRAKIFISAHNGHIEKSSAAFGYKSMGDYLDETYGNQYFAIGTDFMKNTFQADNKATNKRKNYTIKNSDDFAKAFGGVERETFYIDFESARNSQEIEDIIMSKQKMPNIGDDFRSWYKFLKFFYTIEMVPNDAYDGIIIIKNGSPTTVID